MKRRTRRQIAALSNKEDIPVPVPLEPSVQVNESPILKAVTKTISTGSTSTEPKESTPKKVEVKSKVKKRKPKPKEIPKEAPKRIVLSSISDAVNDALNLPLTHPTGVSVSYAYLL